jgi:phospholipase A1
MRRIFLALLLLAFSGASLAARSAAQCRDEYPGDDAQHRQERLKCYDEAALATTTSLLTASPASGARLWDAWRLGERDIPLGAPQLYHPIYFIARWSDDLNYSPASPSHPASPSLNLRRVEAKFQLSFKSELVSPETSERALNTDRFRLWLGYTQQSNWQILDNNDSRPFRNTNYTPELILTARVSKSDSPSVVPMLLNFGLWEHQSNGQSDPLSRSWNRSYVQAGWQLEENFSLLARVWQRWSENSVSDDNPDIVSYMGRWELLLRRDLGRTRASLLLRNRFLQFDWGVPVGGTQFHAQITSGYGEDLLDYNHRQTTFGIGFSFGAW